MTAREHTPPPLRAVLAAWSVHALTASGAWAGVLALTEAHYGHWRRYFWWLVLATVIDACDGALARRFRVKEILPRVDGALLDNIVDYFTYVLVPAVFVLLSGKFSAWGGAAAAGLMVFSSAYQFCQSDAKTHDHYFKGWPSYWNIVVFYIYLLDWGPHTNFGLVLLCAVLVFVPIKYLYPSRTMRLRRLTLALTIGWGALVFWLLWRPEQTDRRLAYLSLLYAAYYMGASIWITLGEFRERTGRRRS